MRRYVEDFELDASHLVLDPFCGTGTTLVEAKLCGIPSVGLEANPVAQLASSVKVDWSIDPDGFLQQAEHIAFCARSNLKDQGIDDAQAFPSHEIDVTLRTLEPEAAELLLGNSISPLPLHKVLVLLDCIEQHHDEPYYRHEILALAKALVFSISNLHFGPEVGVGKPRRDAPVVSSWLSEVKRMANDLHLVAGREYPPAMVHLADARQLDSLGPNSIDAVITSPPYPNEKDYTRTTRLESVILGFIHNRAELQALKKSLVRSNTRGVYKGDDDDQWVVGNQEIQAIAERIEKRRLELEKDSGFEKLYGRVTKLYFGGMARHLASLRRVLRPGARLAYVVGDQASYLRVMIRTGQLLADIAQELGYDLVRLDLFRTRFATATKEQLDEQVVVLRWPG